MLFIFQLRLNIQIMIASLLYVIFAILGLSFLIFIHELGHYWVARRVGMRVETFSIGFGKPIYTWTRNGVKWQIGWLIFGGFVKIAGTETDSKKNLYKIPDGFFGKKPLDRIKVAFAGPLVNLLFAFLVFVLLWVGGGREKSFSEYTTKIGWVDPQSELYVLGVRPGDKIVSYDGRSFRNFRDHQTAPMTSGNEIKVQGFKVDYKTGIKKPFEYTVNTYPDPRSLNRDIVTAGILQPARYVIYDRLPTGKDNTLPEGSPLRRSGFKYGDRILWVDGEMIYSDVQLSRIINDERVLMTIVRGQRTLLRRVPRIPVYELRPDPEYREELIDWQYEAGINTRKPEELYTTPYNLTYDCVVENVLRFIDEENQEEAFPQHPFSERELPLQPGDKIIAVNGIPIKFSYQLLAELQEDKVNVIVQREPKAIVKLSWIEADADFNTHIDWEALDKIAHSIGTDTPLRSEGNLHLLTPIEPKKRGELELSPEKQAWLAAEIQEKKKEIQTIEDPESRTQALKLLKSHEERLLLGIPNIQDRSITYNPKPTEMFVNVFRDIWRMLIALFTLALSPKFIMGPVGIVQAVQQTTMLFGIKESLYWIGFISLNLGVLNLLPIPVLDGGTIVLSLFEMVTGKQLKPKTLEKLIIPFAILLIALFIYITYNDIMRIFGRFLP